MDNGKIGNIGKRIVAPMSFSLVARMHPRLRAYYWSFLSRSFLPRQKKREKFGNVSFNNMCVHSRPDTFCWYKSFCGIPRRGSWCKKRLNYKRAKCLHKKVCESWEFSIKKQTVVLRARPVTTFGAGQHQNPLLRRLYRPPPLFYQGNIPRFLANNSIIL